MNFYGNLLPKILKIAEENSTMKFIDFLVSKSLLSELITSFCSKNRIKREKNTQMSPWNCELNQHWLEKVYGGEDMENYVKNSVEVDS